MYLLDANVFIAAKNHHYGFAIAPGFWRWPEREYDAGTVCSIDKVYNEIAAGEDELAEWAKHYASIFVGGDAAMVRSLRELASWARTSGRFTPAASSEFLSVADCYLLAFAHAHELIVATHEQPDHRARKRIKIPEACDHLGVSWTDPFTMLEQEHATLVLDEP